MTVKNYTPHSITIAGVTYPSEGCARVSVEEEIDAHTGFPFPVVRETFGKVVGLPEVPEPDTMYLVSRVVATALQAECDGAADADRPARVARAGACAVPASFIRDEAGRIIGAKGAALVRA